MKATRGPVQHRLDRRAFLALASLGGLPGCAVQTAALREHPPAGLPRHAELTAVPFHPQSDYQCGPAALATALGAVGIEAPPAALADEVFLPARAGTLQAEMLAGARRRGAVATRIPGTLPALLQEVAAGHAVVVLQNLGLRFAPRWHYAVVVGYDLDAMEILQRSGAMRRDVTRMRTFEHIWARSGCWAFVALPPGEWPVTAQLEAVVEAAVGFERTASPLQAEEVYRSALLLWPESLTLAIGLGNSLYAQGDKPRAAEVFRRAAQRHGNGAAWLNLAQVLLELGAREEAVEAATRAAGDPAWQAQARRFLAGAQPTMRP